MRGKGRNRGTDVARVLLRVVVGGTMVAHGINNGLTLLMLLLVAG